MIYKKHKSLAIIALLVFLQTGHGKAASVDLRDFNEQINEIKEDYDFSTDSPEFQLLTVLEAVGSNLTKNPAPEVVVQTLSVIDSTALIEAAFPSTAKVSFADDFLVGSNLSVSDLANASFFLNSLNAKRLSLTTEAQSLTLNSTAGLGPIQEQVFNFSNTNPAALINELKNAGQIDLVQLSAAIESEANGLSSSIQQASETIQQQDLGSAAEQVASATQTISFATGAALAAAGASLDQAAQTISDAIAGGVSMDLEAASQGLGFDSFSEAVDAYNEQYGTSYTVDSAREALGQ